MPEEQAPGQLHVAAAGLAASVLLLSPIPAVIALAFIAALTLSGPRPVPAEEAPA